MIDVIVGFRDVVFAALVAWTGAPGADSPKAAKDKDPDGKPVGEYPVVALETISVANVFVRAWDSLRLLFN